MDHLLKSSLRNHRSRLQSNELTSPKLDYQALLERKLTEQHSLYEISAFASKAESEEEIISFVTKILFAELYSDHLGLLFLDESTNTISVHESYLGIPEELKKKHFELGEGIVGRVIETGIPVRIGNNKQVSNYIPGSRMELVSELCVPILVDDRVIGAINAESRHLDFFSEQDEKFLITVANEVGTGLSRLRLLKREVQRRVEAELSERISRELTRTLDLDESLWIILENLQEYLNFDSASAFLHEDGYLKVAAVKGVADPEKFLKIAVDAEKDLLFNELRIKKTPMILEDTEADPRFMDYGDLHNVRGWMGIPLIAENEVFGYFTFDSTTPGKFTPENGKYVQTLINQISGAISRAKLFEQTHTRYQRLKALHDIDLLITSNLDLSASLDSVLEIVCSILTVDAAAILTYDPDTQMLQVKQTHGIKTSALGNSQLALREGYAGKVALEHKPIFIPRFDFKLVPFSKLPSYFDEKLSSYYALPIMSRGDLIGVLELFSRTEIKTNQEWEDFVHSLATQIAIAIENSSLIENYEKANLELSLGIDATLEGWAKTLELRDRETEGHSKRVVDLTVRLARKFGLPLEEIIHARRGALLHDIGKIGIPDSILLKPGPLNEEEWKVMKLHPVYAYEALKDNQFIKPALAIPCAHHEKWDGTGYPHGLKGEAIPLPARLFAVIDVYDALRSDRPYRDAWPREKVLKHIREQSGKHFDPQVVAAFLLMLSKSTELVD